MIVNYIYVVEDKEKYYIKSARNLLLFISLVLLMFLLKTLGGILLPLVMAMLLTVLTLPSIYWLRQKKFPKPLIVPLVAILSISIIFLLINILSNTVGSIMEEQEFLISQLTKKLEQVLDFINTKIPINANSEQTLNMLFGNFDSESIGETIKGVAGGLGSFGRNFFMFMLYYLFLIAGASNYKEYMHFVVGSNRSMLHTITTVQESISQYMIIKSLISVTTAILAYIVCLAVGIKFAFIWALFTFILNFVPTIGSIIATIPPVLMAAIQYDSIDKMIIVFILLLIIQQTIGNVIDPLVMGNRMRLNPVTVIFGLIFWGFIWGVAGMLLSVPLMVVMKLIMEKSESLSILARVMGYPENNNEKRTLFKKKKK